ncbi:(d)CMP kinase [Micrococcales bacterium 31B]|nr:(d)CMP kinase [Micrococcales bacterium 31B]
MTNPPAPFVVAIDGPSGSGKSTVARQIAAARGYRYLDTGAMYRALTWYALHLGLDVEADLQGVAHAARDMPLDISLDPAVERVTVDGHEVTQEIRTQRITEHVSAIATNTLARPLVQQAQRDLIAAASPGIVVEGRDITTVIAPTAPVRVLLVASEESRLRRRARQQEDVDGALSGADLARQVLQRDAKDSAVSVFNIAADGVVTVDSSDLTLAETVAAVDSLVSDALAALDTPEAR